jgi:hypothetical protein
MGITGKKSKKKGSVYPTTKLIPVTPVIPVVGSLLSSTQDWD